MWSMLDFDMQAKYLGEDWNLVSVSEVAHFPQSCFHMGSGVEVMEVSQCCLVDYCLVGLAKYYKFLFYGILALL